MNRDTDVLLKKLNHQNKEVDAIYYKIASAWGLSESTFWILYTIAKSPHEYSQQDICTELSISKTTVNSAIQSLAQKGYVFLERDSDSARKKIVRMTEYGKQFVKRHIVPLQKTEQKAFLKMDIQERESYIDLSQKYIANLREETEVFLKLHQK